MDEQQRAQRRRELNELQDEITRLIGHLNAANYRFLKLLAEFDRREGWADGDTHSCAHWLNWKCGLAMGAAREKVRVARALENLPKLSASMARGEISYSKVREITRVACPVTEESLLMLARYGTTHHVERMVRAFRRAKDAEELSREAIQQAERYVSYQHDADGSLILRARLPAETGALVMKALEVALNEIPLDQVHESPHEVPPVIDKESRKRTPTVKHVFGARRADALAIVAESFLQNGTAATNGGDRTQIIVHVAAETLQRNDPGCCEFEDGPSMAAETARRLACDASLVPLIENEDGEPLNVGRKTRTISPALRRFLKARDKGCRFPGCPHTRHIDAHHIRHWAQGGETKPSNLVSLCSFHHRKVHEGGIEVRMLDDGAVRFVKLDGTVIDGRVPQLQGEWQQLILEHERDGVSIDEKTAVTRWDGTRCDYGLGIDSLMSKLQVARESTPDCHASVKRYRERLAAQEAEVARGDGWDLASNVPGGTWWE